MRNERKNEIKTGDTAMLKVGRNEVKVKILNPMAGGSAFMVKSLSSGKAFMVQGSRLTMPTDNLEPSKPKLEEPAPVSVESETDETQDLAPEAALSKRISLMDAAVAVLKESGEPMNTREMVKAAIERGYWTPTACKTPEQTLYGNIFRDIKTKEPPSSSRATSRGSSSRTDGSLTETLK